MMGRTIVGISIFIEVFFIIYSIFLRICVDFSRVTWQRAACSL